MTRRLTTLTALLASLAAAPAAHAVTFTVNDPGDTPDQSTADNNCRTASNTCTLRAAIQQANATAATDSIVFADPPALTATTIAPLTPLPRITARTTIDGGGDITIAPGAAFPAPPLANAPLIEFKPATPPTTSAAGSTLRRITLDGDPDGSGPRRAGPLVRVEVDDVTIESVTARNSADDGIEVAGDAQRVRITRSPVFAFAPDRQPILLEPGGNDNLPAPTDLRVGPRRADGSLPITGNSQPGTIELFRGDPMTGPQEFTAEAPGGAFAFALNPEPAPGERFSATLTDSASNTSQFASVTTPGDLTSPRIVAGVATSLDQVRVTPSEPIAATSVQPEDFSLVMAGSERAVTGVSVAPDGSSVTLTSATPWLHGEAGSVALRAPAGFTDPSGNESPLLGPVRVGGAPGDFVSPRISTLRINPRRKVCITKGPRCKKPGTQVSFISSEDGDAYFTFLRGNRVLGQRRYAAKPGRNRIRFDGRLRGRKLTAGRYTVRVGVEDAVGNLSLKQPSLPVRIINTTRRR
jgi:hypothetical protein